MESLNNLEEYLATTRSHVANAWNTLKSMQERTFYMSFDEERGGYYDEEYDWDAECLERALRAIHLRLLFAYQCLGAHLSARQLQKDFEKVADGLQTFYIDDCGMEARNKGLDVLLMHLGVLTVRDESDEADQSGSHDPKMILRSILQNTASIIYDRQLQPENEAQVREAVFHVMKHTFPDAVREIPLPKSVQTYKPDLGVKSLKTAIEYKFADSADEVKSSIRGIFEDMKGYSDSKDWNTFYAVIYMTEAYFTNDQIVNDLKVGDAPPNWRFIVVNGRGARKRRRSGALEA